MVIRWIYTFYWDTILKNSFITGRCIGARLNSYIVSSRRDLEINRWCCTNSVYFTYYIVSGSRCKCPGRINYFTKTVKDWQLWYFISSTSCCLNFKVPGLFNFKFKYIKVISDFFRTHRKWPCFATVPGIYRFNKFNVPRIQNNIIKGCRCRLWGFIIFPGGPGINNRRQGCHSISTDRISACDIFPEFFPGGAKDFSGTPCRITASWKSLPVFIDIAQYFNFSYRWYNLNFSKT